MALWAAAEDISSPGMCGMTVTQQADMLEVQVRTVTDSESRTFLKAASTGRGGPMPSGAADEGPAPDLRARVHGASR